MAPGDQEEHAKEAGFLPGLIFAWRARRRTNFGHLALALVTVAVGVVGLGALLTVEGRPSRETPVSRSAAGVMILRADDQVSRDLIEWSREESPDAARWEPDSGAALARVLLEIENEMRSASRYQPRLRPAPTRGEASDEDPVTALIAPQLPPVSVPPVLGRGVEGTEVVPQLVFEVSGNLRERWRDPEKEWTGEEGLAFFGREAAFSIAVDERGEVQFCLPSREVDPELDRKLQQRLRGHRIEEDDGSGLTWGTVTVRIEAEGGEEAGP